MLKEKEDDFYLFFFLTDEDIRIFLSILLFFLGYIQSLRSPHTRQKTIYVT